MIRVTQEKTAVFVDFLGLSAIVTWVSWPWVTKSDYQAMLPMHMCRDKSILLLFSPIFLSGNSFLLTYYAQDFVQSFNILLKVKL